jgi:hypothetical protein
MYFNTEWTSKNYIMGTSGEMSSINWEMKLYKYIEDIQISRWTFFYKKIRGIVTVMSGLPLPSANLNLDHNF